MSDDDNSTYEYVVTGITNNTTVEKPPDWMESPGCQMYTFMMYSVLMGLMCILGLIGNVISFLVFWKDKLKTSSSFLFQGLSLVDILMLLIAIPVYIIPPFVQYTQWFTIFGQVEAYVLVYMFPSMFIAQSATIWLTVLVCVNRYIAVCKPYQASRLCTVTQARKQFALVLLCSVIYNIPHYAEGRINYDKNGNPTPTHTALGENEYYNIIYLNSCYVMFMLVIPLLTLTILNIRLISALKEIKKRRAEMNLRQQQDNNVTLVLIIVVIVFTICQAPALVTQLSWTVLPNSARQCGGFQYYYSRLSNVLVILNSSVNFLIYFLFNQRFRMIFTETMCSSNDADRGSAYGTVNNHAPPATTITRTNTVIDHTTIPTRNSTVANGDDTNETLL